MNQMRSILSQMLQNKYECCVFVEMFYNRFSIVLLKDLLSFNLIEKSIHAHEHKHT